MLAVVMEVLLAAVVVGSVTLDPLVGSAAEVRYSRSHRHRGRQARNGAPHTTMSITSPPTKHHRDAGDAAHSGASALPADALAQVSALLAQQAAENAAAQAAMQARFDAQLASAVASLSGQSSQKDAELANAHRVHDLLRAEARAAQDDAAQARDEHLAHKAAAARAMHDADQSARASAEAEAEKRHHAATAHLESQAQRRYDEDVGLLRTELATATAASKAASGSTVPPPPCPECPRKQAALEHARAMLHDVQETLDMERAARAQLDKDLGAASARMRDVELQANEAILANQAAIAERDAAKSAVSAAQADHAQQLRDTTACYQRQLADARAQHGIREEELSRHAEGLSHELEAVNGI